METTASTPIPTAFRQTAQSSPLEGTESAALALQRVHYTHDAMIDLIIGSPAIKQGEIAKHFGYTEPWISRIMNSDAFLARLAERKKDLVDGVLVQTLDEKMRNLAAISLDVITEKLAVTKNPDTALKALELTSRALGYGARQANLNVQQNFVVAMPTQAQSPEAWAQAHKERMLAPGLTAMVQDVEAKAA